MPAATAGENTGPRLRQGIRSNTVAKSNDACARSRAAAAGVGSTDSRSSSLLQSFHPERPSDRKGALRRGAEAEDRDAGTTSRRQAQRWWRTIAARSRLQMRGGGPNSTTTRPEADRRRPAIDRGRPRHIARGPRRRNPHWSLGRSQQAVARRCPATLRDRNVAQLLKLGFRDPLRTRPRRRRGRGGDDRHDLADQSLGKLEDRSGQRFV